MKLFNLLILASIICLQGIAQTSPQLDCQFQFDSYQLDKKSMSSLDSIFSKYQLGISEIFLAGRTDSVGGYDYNTTLAAQRINAVNNYIASKGLLAKQISKKIYGEQNPLAGNETPEGRLQNRSVRVILNLYNGYTDDFNFIFSRLKPEPSTFDVSTAQQTTIRTQGCVITIPANSFVNSKGFPVAGKVRLEVTACLDYHTMLLSNLTTTTTDQRPLETGGMINISAPEGSGISLRKGAQIKIKIPSTALKDSMQLFFAQTDSTGTSWFQPEGDVPSLVYNERMNFNLELLYKESLTKDETAALNLLTQELSQGNNSDVVATLIGKLFQARDERKLNFVISRLKLQDIRFMNSKPNPGFENTGGYYAFKSSTMRYLSLADLIARYKDFSDAKYILYTINDQRFGNSVDSSLNIRQVKIENYVLSMTNLGWINCDRFVNRGDTTSFLAIADPGYQPEYRLVMKEFKGLYPPARNDQQPGKGFFQNIPKGTKATLIAYALKDGELYYSSKDILVGAQPEEKVDLQKTTLHGLGEQLAMLNKAM